MSERDGDDGEELVNDTLDEDSPGDHVPGEGTAGSDASADDSHADTDALLSRLQVIGDQPLASRAEALGQVHDELRRRLESGDVIRADG